MMSVLNNEQLVDSISTGDALVEVHIELLKDSNTISGYKWTTKNGAPVTIAPGTVCSAKIEIGSSKPIEIVFPFIKNIMESISNTGEQL
jgi:spore maturation protein SpmA